MIVLKWRQSEISIDITWHCLQTFSTNDTTFCSNPAIISSSQCINQSKFFVEETCSQAINDSGSGCIGDQWHVLTPGPVTRGAWHDYTLHHCSDTVLVTLHQLQHHWSEGRDQSVSHAQVGGWIAWCDEWCHVSNWDCYHNYVIRGNMEILTSSEFSDILNFFF